MRFIAKVARWTFMLDSRGQLFHVPLVAGQTGYPVDADLASDSCRRHAIEADAEGNHAKAAQLRRAAVALDALVDLPEASAPATVQRPAA